MYDDDSSSLRWTTAYAAHSAALREFVLTRVPAPEVDDLLQEVWASFAAALKRQDIVQPRAWLYRVTRNRITDLYRSRGTRPEFLDITPAVATAPPPPGEDVVWENIEAALEALPATQREVFVRNELGGETLREIAEELGVPLKTVISRKGYARRRLQDLLRETYEGYFAPE